MNVYRIFVQCSECQDMHPMPIAVTLDDEHSTQISVADAYQGKSVPSPVATLVGNSIPCPITKKMLVPDNTQVFLVPATGLTPNPEIK